MKRIEDVEYDPEKRPNRPFRLPPQTLLTENEAISVAKQILVLSSGEWLDMAAARAELAKRARETLEADSDDLTELDDGS